MQPWGLGSGIMRVCVVGLAARVAIGLTDTGHAMSSGMEKDCGMAKEEAEIAATADNVASIKRATQEKTSIQTLRIISETRFRESTLNLIVHTNHTYGLI